MKCGWIEEICINIEEGSLATMAIQSQQKFIQSKIHHFQCKQPHHGSDIVWPMLFCLQKEGARDQCQLFNTLLDDSILMMSSNCTESNTLIFVFDSFLKPSICKASVVGSIRMDRNTTIIGLLFER